MSNTQVYPHTKIRLYFYFTDSNDAYVDPDGVVVKYRSPDGTVTTKTYGTDAEVVRESTGIYYCLMTPEQSGYWQYAVKSTGDDAVAKEWAFTARDTVIEWS